MNNRDEKRDSLAHVYINANSVYMGEEDTMQMNKAFIAGWDACSTHYNHDQILTEHLELRARIASLEGALDEAMSVLANLDGENYYDHEDFKKHIDEALTEKESE